VRENVDDIGFFSNLIDHLAATYPIDSKRVFATGISNGGFMSFALGCFLDDKIRGIAPVTATLTEAIFPRCDSKTSTTLVLFNGTEDPLVPYNGGPITVLRKKRGQITSTDATIKRWVERNDCSLPPTITVLPNKERDLTSVERRDYTGCSDGAKVTLFKINGGGHTWPGGRQYLPVILIGKVSYDIDAAEEMWRIFRSLP
jgi:polyhydroxybutyrate depolymerase